jgi:hypothetical protein
MKSSYRFSTFTLLFFIFSSIFGFFDTNQSKSYNAFLYPRESQQGPAAVLPVTAAPTVIQKDGIPQDITLLSRIFKQSLNAPARAASIYPHSENLHGFIELVGNNGLQELTGVFVEDVMALPVVQQPEGDSLYVSRLLGNVTQFQSAARNGVTGLLAHNYLSGDLFFDLELDQEVHLVYGDGSVSRYMVEDIQRYEKLEGDLQNSYYVNLDTGEMVSTPDLFGRMYTGSEKVTFQTCIKKGTDWSWGRIFITATPLP